MDFRTYLATNFRFSESFLDELLESCHNKNYSKGDRVLEPGEISKNVYFVEKGIVRVFYFKGNRLITHFFFLESSFVTSSESLFLNKESMYGIEAIEKSKLTVIPYYLIKQIAQDNIEMNKVVQSILTNTLMAFSKRLTSLQFETAAEKYQHLLDTSPELILRASLGDIASYLGISQQTLSVIRSQLK